MDGNKEICLLLVCKGCSLFKRDKDIFIPGEKDFETFCSQAFRKRYAYCKGDIFFLLTMWSYSTGVPPSMAWINDDL